MELHPLDVPVGVLVGIFSLLLGGGGGHSSLCATPCQLDLSCIRKVAEGQPGSKSPFKKMSWRNYLVRYRPRFKFQNPHNKTFKKKKKRNGAMNL